MKVWSKNCGRVMELRDLPWSELAPIPALIAVGSLIVTSDQREEIGAEIERRRMPGGTDAEQGVA